MASQMAIKRLQREYITIQTNPPAHITARPAPEDILTWHYLLEGPPGTPYEGGFYHGTLKFPVNFPYAPPSIVMCTPNGRFHTNQRLCLSMSDFHPAEWNPMWSTSTILSGLLSFMTEETPTHGSMETSVEARVRYSSLSPENNLRSDVFVKMFPEMIDKLRAMRDDRRKETGGGRSVTSSSGAGGAVVGGGTGGVGGGGNSVAFVKYVVIMVLTVMLSYFVL